jgi:hypothetical protein
MTLCLDKDLSTAAICRHKKSRCKTDLGCLLLDIHEPGLVNDLNHWVKNVGGVLFGIARGPKSISRLDTFDAHRLKRNCSCAAHQGDKSTIASFQAAFVPVSLHHFNIHGECGDWCRKAVSLSSAGEYRSAKVWSKEFEQVKEIIRGYTTPDELRKIRHSITTNTNEAMNKANCRHNPKDSFLAGSDVYKYRRAVTVGQLSIGHEKYFERVLCRHRYDNEPNNDQHVSDSRCR